MKGATSEELLRAKNSLKSSIYMNLECRGIVMEDIGRRKFPCTSHIFFPSCVQQPSVAILFGGLKQPLLASIWDKPQP